MRLFYCNNALTHIQHPSTSEFIFRTQAINLAIKDLHNTQRLISVDLFNSPFLTMHPKYFVPYRYSAFGFSPPSDSGWCFKGEREDPISNGYLLGNGRRLYSPSLMRFTSPDALSPFSKGGLSYYAFALNDPISNSDPSGEFTVSPRKFLIRLFTKKIYKGSIAWQHDGLTAYAKPPRNDGKLSTLYISGHGDSGYAIGDQYKYSASSLYAALEQAGIEMKSRQTHFLTCKSAVPESPQGLSLAENMARLTGAQASGYHKGVNVYGTTDKNGQYVDRLLRIPVFDYFYGVTSTKTRQGNIRNPEKLKTLRNGRG